MSANNQPVLNRRQVLRSSLLLLLPGFLQACQNAGEPKKLSFLNWQDYIGPDTLAAFTKATGVEVTYQTYASNDELTWLLSRAGGVRRGGRKGDGYDLAVPSNETLLRFRRAGLISEFKADAIKGLEHLRPEIRNRKLDPQNSFSVPWATGTTGIAYDSSLMPEPKGWEIFADPAFAGRMSILDEQREAFAVALRSLGKSVNSVDPNDIRAAEAKLLEIKRYAQLNAKTYLKKLIAGELVLAQAFSSDFVIARTQRPSLKFVLPTQGATRWVDSLVIPRDAARPGRALEFINYFLQPEVSAGVMAAAKVDTGNQAAFDRLEPALRNDPVIFPSLNVLAKLEFFADLGAAQAWYDEAWKRIKAA